MSRTLIPVNRIGVEERAAQLGRRSIKTSAKREGIRIATSMIEPSVSSMLPMTKSGVVSVTPFTVRVALGPAPDAAMSPRMSEPSPVFRTESMMLSA